nr:hypothetical protein HK105_001926 [Polyrhizophydium stewartii]
MRASPLVVASPSSPPSPFSDSDSDSDFDVATATSNPRSVGSRHLRRRVSGALPQRTGTAVLRLADLADALLAAFPSPDSLAARSDFVEAIADAWPLAHIAALSDADLAALVAAFARGVRSPSRELLAAPPAPQVALVPALAPSAFIDGSDAVSRIAYALSDLVFVFPVLQTQFVGRHALDLAASATPNAAGSVPQVLKMTSSVSAGRVLQGAGESSLSVSAVLSSTALGALLPSMYSIAREAKAPVLHVAAHQIDSDFAVHSNYAAILRAAHTGFAILASASVQEAHDMAIAAHAIAAALHVPVLHVLDGPRTAAQVAAVRAADPAAVRAAIAALPSHAHPTSPERRFDAVTEVLAALTRSLFASTSAAKYAPLEYSGPAAPATVVVSMGTASALVRDAIADDLSASASVGALNIRLFRPWSSAALLSAIPASTKTVVVIGDATDGSPSHSLFTLDVVAALFSAARPAGAAPFKIVKATFERGSIHFSSHAVAPLLARLAASPKSATISETATIGLDDTAIEAAARRAAASADATGTTEAIFWDRDSTGTHESIARIQGHLAATDGLRLQRFDQHLSARLDPKTVSHLRFGQREILSADPVIAAKIVMCNDATILAEHNIASSLRRGGHLFVNSPLSPADLASSLAQNVRQAIVDRGVTLHTLDVDGIAKHFTIFYGKPVDFVADILAAVFVKLALGASPEYEAHRARFVQGIKDTHADAINVARAKLNAVDRALAQISALPSSAIDTKPANSDDTEAAEQHLPAAHEAVVTIPALPVAVSEDAGAAGSSGATLSIASSFRALLPAIFPSAFKLKRALRPDVDEAFQVTVTKNIRLTPESYDRNVFHMEMDTTGTGLKYDIGDALGVHAHNDAAQVRDFLDWAGLDGRSVVAVERTVGGRAVSEIRALEQLLVQHLDLFGKPGKKFYQLLAERATDEAEQERLLTLLDSTENLEHYATTVMSNHADLLRTFPSARLSAAELVAAIPEIKPRHYSIASSQRVHPNSVHLLVVLVDWKTAAGETRYGQATRYLVNAAVGQKLTVSIKPSVMKLPPRHTDPVVMAGLGTGMAPFRAFIEERWYWKSRGHAIGPMVLYFGSRHRAQEYLYGEELDAYHADGVLTHLRLAFSRDQKDKIYIQHKIQEDARLLNSLMLQSPGVFYLCGPTWPVPDVSSALIDAFAVTLDRAEATHLLDEFKEKERYILEVY